VAIQTRSLASLSRLTIVLLIGSFRRSGPPRTTWTTSPGSVTPRLREIGDGRDLLAGGEEPVVGEDVLELATTGPSASTWTSRQCPQGLVEALVFAADVHPADEREGAVDDLQLAVVAQVEEEPVALGIEALEPGEMAAGRPQVASRLLGEAVGADPVEEEADGHAAPRGRGQKARNLAPVSSGFQM
jgi:hypothetical protein